MKHSNFSLLMASLIISIIVTGCKKQSTVNNLVEPPVDTSLAPNELLDSTLLLTRDIYLWYNQIPSGFSARSYADPGKVMEAIRQYSIEPGFAEPVDKWSFAIKKVDWDNQSNGIVMSTAGTAVTGDFGISVFFKKDGDLRVRLVEGSSPAGQAGVHRGWRITKINGSTNLTIANSDFIIDNVYNSSSSVFTFVKPDGTTVDITLNAGTYKTRPVYLDTVYTYPTKKVGYLVFNSFLGDTVQMYNGLQSAFTKFSNNNITDIVVDLRYNGGGYVSVQEKLADLLVPSSANNSVMFREQFNDKNSQYNSVTNFQKAGLLNLDHIYFIVSGSTASASELLINNLDPYMDVELVGPAHTYGKPVGFFPTSVGEWYIFPVSFKSTNKNGAGEYFGGLPVNNEVADGLDKDWGDVTEACLASVLKRITTGAFRPEVSSESRGLPDDVKKANDKLDEPFFKGSVGTIRQAK